MPRCFIGVHGNGIEEALYDGYAAIDVSDLEAVSVGNPRDESPRSRQRPLSNRPERYSRAECAFGKMRNDTVVGSRQWVPNRAIGSDGDELGPGQQPTGWSRPSDCPARVVHAPSFRCDQFGRKVRADVAGPCLQECTVEVEDREPRLLLDDESLPRIDCYASHPEELARPFALSTDVE